MLHNIIGEDSSNVRMNLSYFFFCFAENWDGKAAIEWANNEKGDVIIDHAVDDAADAH